MYTIVPSTGISVAVLRADWVNPRACGSAPAPAAMSAASTSNATTRGLAAEAGMIGTDPRTAVSTCQRRARHVLSESYFGGMFWLRRKKFVGS